MTALRVMMPGFSGDRPGMPDYWGYNPLADYSDCLAAWDFSTEGDQSGNGYDLKGSLNFDQDQGLLLPGGASGIHTGLVLPNDSSFVAVFKVDAANAADGFVWSAMNTTSMQGFALRYTDSSGAIVLQVQPTSGAVVPTPSTITRPNGVWCAVGGRTYSSPGAVSFLTANPSEDAISGAIGARTTNTIELYLGDSPGTSTKGVAGVLGMLAFYNSLLASADLDTRIAVAKARMLELRGITVP